MSICLCNLSADTILELAAQNKLELEPASPDPSSFVMDPTLAKEALGSLMERLPKPIELMVGDTKERRAFTEMACHTWRASLPTNSFFALSEGVYVTSPELTLLQQANQLHQASLCQMLGRYLGTWTPAEDEPSGQLERAPLTTLETLSGYLRGMKSVGGMNNLKLAMAYTCEGAASEPETSFQLALSLPPELYGLNILQPTMNYELQLSTEAQTLYPHETIRIDLCWPEKRLGIEYQGEEHGNQLGDDYARLFAARSEKYELWLVAKEQLESAAQMKFIAREAAKRIDYDVDEGLWPTDDELQELLDILTRRKHPKPVSRDELRVRRAKAKAWRRSIARP